MAADTDVERISDGLVKYITTMCLSELTLKITICEALYEMQAISRGEKYRPAIMVNGAPPHAVS